MSLRPIYGHQALLDRLAGTLASSRFPQATLLTGAPGVGKQRLALWIAQGLLCQVGPGAPCGSCAACHQVVGLQHPDLHWFVPIPRPKAGDPGKQVEEVEELLGQAMAERREEGLWGRPDGMTGHPLASVRLLHRLAWVTPFSGARKVFVLGHAERLIVQESAPEAANALLKVLEEPAADTTVILTAADPNGLLPTVRSRVTAFRVSRVTDEAVRSFLAAELGQDPGDEALERRVLLAEGSIGQALWLEQDDATEPQRAAAAFLEAVRRGRDRWLPAALSQTPWSARGEFTAMLDALAVRLRAELATEAEKPGPAAVKRTEALRRVETARADAQGNVNPQIALAVLADDLESLV